MFDAVNLKGSGKPDARVLDEAAAWLLRLHEGNPSADELAALDSWRNENPQHEQAWQHTQAFLQNLRKVPASIGHSALRRPARRVALQKLALLIAAAPLAFATYRLEPWQHLTADYRTATGEQKQLTLPDGTLLTLNTATVVDFHSNGQHRELRLHSGEIMVTTAPDVRPLFVATAQGRVQPIGTRFSVRQFDQHTGVVVFEGAVELSPSNGGDVIRLAAGQGARFTASSVQEPQSVSPIASLWIKGMIVVENIRLGELVAELDRYRVGRLRCDPEVESLRISGAFPVADIPRSLQLIQNILPVQISQTLSYWTVIEARPQKVAST